MAELAAFLTLLNSLSPLAVIGLLGFLSDRALRALGRALTPWAQTVAAP